MARRTFDRRPRHAPVRSSRSLFSLPLSTPRSDTVSHTSSNGLFHFLSEPRPTVHDLFTAVYAESHTEPQSRGTLRDPLSNSETLHQRALPTKSTPIANMTMTDPSQDRPADGMAGQEPMPILVSGEANNQTPLLAKAVSATDSASVTTAESDSTIGRNSVKIGAKVAIPRQRTGVTPRYNRRVPRACESCRQRKTKCSGDTPVCRQCRELRVTCQYPVGWKERTKR